MKDQDDPADVTITIDCSTCTFDIDGATCTCYNANGECTEFAVEAKKNRWLSFVLSNGPPDAYAIAIVGSVDGAFGAGHRGQAGCNDNAVAFTANAPGRLKVRAKAFKDPFPITLLCMARDADGFYQPADGCPSTMLMMTTGGPKMKVDP